MLKLLQVNLEVNIFKFEAHILLFEGEERDSIASMNNN